MPGCLSICFPFFLLNGQGGHTTANFAVIQPPYINKKEKKFDREHIKLYIYNMPNNLKKRKKIGKKLQKKRKNLLFSLAVTGATCSSGVSPLFYYVLLPKMLIYTPRRPASQCRQGLKKRQKMHTLIDKKGKKWLQKMHIEKKKIDQKMHTSFLAQR